MLTERLLDRTPVWLLYVGTVLLLFAASEIGFRIAVWQATRKPQGDRAPTNAIVGSTLGLLAFMLAFTFGASSARFDAKRQLVLDEASAILRTHQRIRLLPEPQRSEASRLLREYIALRIRVPTLQRRAEVEEAVKRAEGIQDALWAQAAALADRPTMVLAGFLQSLTELSDLQIKRVRAAVWNRIPPTIVLMLTIAVLGLTAMGYGAGLVKSRTLAPRSRSSSPSRRSCWSSWRWSGRGRSCSASRRSRSWTWLAASLRLLLLRNSDRRLAWPAGNCRMNPPAPRGRTVRRRNRG